MVTEVQCSEARFAHKALVGADQAMPEPQAGPEEVWGRQKVSAIAEGRAVGLEVVVDDTAVEMVAGCAGFAALEVVVEVGSCMELKVLPFGWCTSMNVVGAAFAAAEVAAVHRSHLVRC